MIKEPMFISPRTFRDYEQYKTDCARASGWNEAMAFIFAEELETERTRTIREKFFVVGTPQKDCETCKHYGVVSVSCDRCDKSTHSRYEPQTDVPRCSINGTPFDECGFCEHFNCDTCQCEADTPQTDCGWGEVK